VSVHLKKIGSDEHLSKAFEYFDKDGSGFIEVDELREALEGDLGPNEQIIKEIISDVDKDNVGLLIYLIIQNSFANNVHTLLATRVQYCVQMVKPKFVCDSGWVPFLSYGNLFGTKNFCYCCCIVFASMFF
jgi:calcium-dependent protein kinase